MDNPFNPGSGTAPPHFGGRNGDLHVFDRCVSKAKKGIMEGPMVLVAPRGQGKTVLLRRMVEKVMSDGGTVLELVPSEIPTPSALAVKLAHAVRSGEGLPIRRERRKKAKGGVPLLGGEMGDVTHMEMDMGSVAESLGKIGAGGMALLAVDEAHELPLDVGWCLLQGEQKARVQGTRLQTVFAGTPDLEPHFQKMRVTFWSRLHDRERRLQLLEGDDAVAAVACPLKDERGLDVDDALRQRIMSMTSGYPYFLQVLGASLWDAAPMDATAFAPDAVALAAKQFQVTKEFYYQKRVDELGDKGLLGAAFAVAAACETKGGALLRQQAQLACQAGKRLGVDDAQPLSPTSAQMVDGLTQQGFVWHGHPTNPRHLVPGIPSLMHYVRQYVAESLDDTADDALCRDEDFSRACRTSRSP